MGPRSSVDDAKDAGADQDRLHPSYRTTRAIAPTVLPEMEHRPGDQDRERE